MSSTSGSRSQPSPSGGSLADVGLARPRYQTGQLVAPPELARDAPRAGCSRASRGRRRVQGSRGGSARGPSRTTSIAGLRELVHVAEPLERDQRLDPLARAVRVRHVVHVGLARREIRPSSRSAATTALARLGDVQARGSARGAASVMRPSSPITEISSSPCRRPISKSFGSWPGRDLQRAGAELGVDVARRR